MLELLDAAIAANAAGEWDAFVAQLQNERPGRASPEIVGLYRRVVPRFPSDDTPPELIRRP